MIDKNKIKSAAQGYCDATYGTLNTNPFIAEAFRKGANWAINEFLKDLWHPANKEPKKVKNLLLETTYEYGKPIYYLIKYMPNGNNVCAWREWYKGAHISRWLYIDDLFPKEGGEQWVKKKLSRKSIKVLTYLNGIVCQRMRKINLFVFLREALKELEE